MSREGTAVPLLNHLLYPKETIALILGSSLRQAGKIAQAATKDPALPYTTALEGQASLGEQIKSIFIAQGINAQTVSSIRPLQQEAQGLIFTVKGLSSKALFQALKEGEITNRPPEEINQVRRLFSFQKDFEQRHPRLTQLFYRFYRNKEIVSGVKNDQILPTCPYWLIQSPNKQTGQSWRWQFLYKINHILERAGLTIHQKVSWQKEIVHNRFAFYISRSWQTFTNWWQQTGLGKRVISRGELSAHYFFQNILVSFRGLGRKASRPVIRTETPSISFAQFAVPKIGSFLKRTSAVIANFSFGLSFNFLKKGLGLFNNLLFTLTGQKAKTEQKPKGPLSFLSSPIAVAFIIALGAPIILILINTTNTGAAIITSVPKEYLGEIPHQGPLSSKVIIPPDNLMTIFQDAADKMCVPVELIMAISGVEGGRAWSYTADEITRFSTPNWWQTDSASLCQGLCYNTCNPGSCSSWDPDCAWTTYNGTYQEADVRGIMQFERNTFNGYHDALVKLLGREPNRCLIPDSIYAGAMKMKANSGTDKTQCTNWSVETVRRVAKAYCGSCNSPNCPNYCDVVVARYLGYQNQK